MIKSVAELPLSAERLARVRLSRTPGVGPVRYRDAMRAYLTAERALEALPLRYAKAGTSVPAAPSAAVILREAEMLARLGGGYVMDGDSFYPAMLRDLPDSPPVFTYIGSPELLNRPSVAVVGGRNASAAGHSVASGLGRAAASAGFAVISGLARGVDRAAHEGALAARGGTVAVVAGGIDVIYPPEHDALYRELCARGGVAAEMPPGTEPVPALFPRRNRIISGLSCVVAVAEASVRSGSLITARYALEQGREVAAAPGSTLDPRCAGSNLLLQRGAHVLVAPEDLVRLAQEASGHAVGLVQEGLEEPALGGYESDPGADPDESRLDAARPRVFKALSPAPVWPEDVARAAGVPVRLVCALLLELDLAGRIERLPDGRVCLIV